jgi:hypothetical protein
MLIHMVESLTLHRRNAGALAVAAVLGWYALTEDFQPNHLRNIDTAEVNFRQNMSPGKRTHYINRTNRRAVADWLLDHADPTTDLIISGNGVTGIDFYYPHFDLVYVDPRDHRLGAWSCQQGTIERWTNLPLVYSMSTLQSRISASHRSFFVIARRRVELLWPDVKQFNPVVVWENEFGFEVIIQLGREESEIRSNREAKPTAPGPGHKISMPQNGATLGLAQFIELVEIRRSIQRETDNRSVRGDGECRDSSHGRTRAEYSAASTESEIQWLSAIC